MSDEGESGLRLSEKLAGPRLPTPAERVVHRKTPPSVPVLSRPLVPGQGQKGPPTVRCAGGAGVPRGLYGQGGGAGCRSNPGEEFANAVCHGFAEEVHRRVHCEARGHAHEGGGLRPGPGGHPVRQRARHRWPRRAGRQRTILGGGVESMAIYFSASNGVVEREASLVQGHIGVMWNRLGPEDASRTSSIAMVGGIFGLSSKRGNWGATERLRARDADGNVDVSKEWRRLVS